MQRAKEAASDVAASAKSGMEKTKATVEGKVSYINVEQFIRYVYMK